MYSKKELKDVLIVGFALFAVFFGAGNIIFPPAIGLASGSSWSPALIGLIITGILLPVLGIIAVSEAGGSFAELSKPVSSWFYIIFNLAVMIGVGMFANIPRTAAVAYELGVHPLFPQIPSLPVIVIYFALAYYFTIDKSSVIDKVGKILTPVMIILLTLIVIKGLILPVGVPSDTGIKNAFSNAFITAYQTGDVLTGLLCGALFVGTIRSKGYTDPKDSKRIVKGASLIAFMGLFIVYGGLLFIGACASGTVPLDTDKSVLLTGLVKQLLGNVGIVMLSVSVFLATLTTCIGLTSSLGDFISEVTKGKISYKACVTVTYIVGIILGNLGVEKIIGYAIPIFVAIYPVAIILVFFGLFNKYIPNKGSYRGAVICTLLISMVDALAMWGLKMPAVSALIAKIPFASSGFAWLIPAIVGFIFGTIIYKMTYKQDLEIVS
ncbi:branched-chain amino acid transport system II carrier protein [Clostridium peptidivorans]|uniref:branched-chain amino acid transport system II carrier protein n=1 Tax=Clostridium peptidivorans TaxID=100174 RepID=UPI000BE22703|nr:branched-chain amino acid transport system II carrier protein [Clostridium peptidivorans]